MPRISFICGFFLFLTILCQDGSGKEVSMKVIDEPSNFGFNNQEPDAPAELKMRIKPSNFSGPAHLKRLDGKCFEKIDDNYKYEFCPFSNLTQHEQSLRWNPYSGVLGVWQEWEIVNNTFKSMLMGEGDACGSKQRQTRVLLECGDDNIIDKVTEPETCQYQLIFKTPLVCHPHAMLVYPTLNSTMRHKWDLIQGELDNEELTVKGYDKAVHQLFESVGYVLHETEKKAIAEKAVQKENQSDSFDTLQQCSEEYQKLKDEIAALRTVLAVGQGTNGTVKKAKEQLGEDIYGDHHEFDQFRYHGDY